MSFLLPITYHFSLITNMKILGIDYGRAKIGLAIAESFLAAPLTVIHVSSREYAIKKIVEVAEGEKVDKVVVGISEGAMADEQKLFATSLSLSISVPVLTWDEGLSTYDAQQMSKETGMSQKKRKDLEDAFAATIMLQSYIDSNT